MTRQFSLLLFLFCVAHLGINAFGQAPYNENQASSNTTKRGLVYIGTSHPEDYHLFTSDAAPITWYYAFTTSPTLRSTSLEFAPMIHGANDAATAVDTVQQLARNGDIEYVLVYNEPDGSTESGGSNISPELAARTYVETIAPLRDEPYNLKLSVPATTGSPNGLEWLKSFNQSCQSLTSGGCDFDFVAAHWYGDFPAMASWLGTLHSYYPQLPIWLTEFALPAFPENVTYDSLNESLAFLDQVEWVERYSYFGTFRRGAANSFTGPNVAMLDDHGGLTEIGNLYLGGAVTGHHVGQTGRSHKRRAPVMPILSVTIAVPLASWILW